MFLVAEMQEYMVMLYGYKRTDRIFQATKSFLHHELDRGCKLSGVKRIRLQDLRHSAVSLLIDLGFSVVAIADRVGHESIEITFWYAHLFPSKQTEMADQLDVQKSEMEGLPYYRRERATERAKEAEMALEKINDEIELVDQKLSDKEGKVAGLNKRIGMLEDWKIATMKDLEQVELKQKELKNIMAPPLYVMYSRNLLARNNYG